MSPRNAVLLAFLSVIAALGCSDPASAATPTPAWSIDSYAYPQVFNTDHQAVCETEFGNLAVEAEQCNAYTITATNVGGEKTKGAITLEATLPPGLVARKVTLLLTKPKPTNPGFDSPELGEKFCTVTPVRCSVPNSYFKENNFAIPPGGTVKIWVTFTLEPAPSPAL